MNFLADVDFQQTSCYDVFNEGNRQAIGETNMNAVTIRYADKKMNMYGLDVNNAPVQAFRVVTGYNAKCNPVYGFQTQLAPDYNMSGKVIFSARTLKALVSKLEKYPDRLVK